MSLNDDMKGKIKEEEGNLRYFTTILEKLKGNSFDKREVREIMRKCKEILEFPIKSIDELFVVSLVFLQCFLIEFGRDFDGDFPTNLIDSDDLIDSDNLIDFPTNSLLNSINSPHGKISLIKAILSNGKLNYSPLFLLNYILQLIPIDSIQIKLISLDCLLIWCRLHLSSNPQSIQIIHHLIYNLWDNHLHSIRRKLLKITTCIFSIISNIPIGHSLLLKNVDDILNGNLTKTSILSVILKIIPSIQLSQNILSSLINDAKKSIKLQSRNIPIISSIISSYSSDNLDHWSNTFISPLIQNFDLSDSTIDLYNDYILKKIAEMDVNLLPVIYSSLPQLESNIILTFKLLLLSRFNPKHLHKVDLELIKNGSISCYPQLKLVSFIITTQKPLYSKYPRLFLDCLLNGGDDLGNDAILKFLLKTLSRPNVPWSEMHQKKEIEEFAYDFLKPSVDPNRITIGLKLLHFIKSYRIDKDVLFSIVSRNLLGINRQLATKLLQGNVTMEDVLKWKDFGMFLIGHPRSLERSRGSCLLSLLAEIDVNITHELMNIVKDEIVKDEIHQILHGALLSLSLISNLPNDIVEISRNIISKGLEYFQNIDDVMEYEEDLNSIKNSKFIISSTFWKSMKISSEIISNLSNDYDLDVNIFENVLIYCRHQGLQGSFYTSLLKLFSRARRDGIWNDGWFDRPISLLDDVNVERLDERYSGLSRIFISLLKSRNFDSIMIDVLLKRLFENVDVNELNVLIWLYKDSEVFVYLPLEKIGTIVLNVMYTSQDMKAKTAINFWSKILLDKFSHDFIECHNFFEKFPKLMKEVMIILNSLVYEKDWKNNVFFPILCLFSRFKNNVWNDFVNDVVILFEGIIGTCNVAACIDLICSIYWNIIPSSHHLEKVGNVMKLLKESKSENEILNWCKILIYWKEFHGIELQKDVIDELIEMCKKKLNFCYTSFVKSYLLKTIRLYHEPISIDFVVNDDFRNDLGKDLLEYELGFISLNTHSKWFMMGYLNSKNHNDDYFINNFNPKWDGDLIIQILKNVKGLTCGDLMGLLKGCKNVDVILESLKYLSRIDIIPSINSLELKILWNLLNNFNDFDVKLEICNVLFNFNVEIDEILCNILIHLLLDDEEEVKRRACRLISHLLKLNHHLDSLHSFKQLSQKFDLKIMLKNMILKQNIANDVDVGIGEIDFIPFKKSIGLEILDKVETLNEEQKEVWKYCPLGLEFYERYYAVYC